MYVLGLHAGLAPRASPSRSRRAAAGGAAARRRARTAARPYARRCTSRSPARARGWCSRTRARADRGALLLPSPLLEAARSALGAEWEDREEELFGPAETLHSTYRLLRDELLEATLRAGGRLGELRFDTDLDVSHAVVRYLELLKLAALIARPEGQSVAEGCATSTRGSSRPSPPSSARSSARRRSTTTCSTPSATPGRRAQAIAARDEPSLEPFLPSAATA